MSRFNLESHLRVAQLRLFTRLPQLKPLCFLCIRASLWALFHHLFIKGNKSRRKRYEIVLSEEVWKVLCNLRNNHIQEMDPLSALSAVGNILQFVEFAVKILSTAKQLYRSSTGTLAVHEELELLANDISGHATRLSRPPYSENKTSGSQGDILIMELCRKCEETAKDLLTRLDSLKTGGDTGVTLSQSVLYALKATWARKDLDALVLKLGDFRKSIETWFLVDIRFRVDTISAQQLDRFEGLDAKSRHIVSSLLDIQDALPTDLQYQLTAVAQILHRIELSVLGQTKDKTKVPTDAPTGPVLSIDDLQYPSEDNNRKEPSNLRVPLHQHEVIMRSTVEASVLEILRFSTMSDRHEEVTEAHRKTFQWIFRPAKAGQTWSPFTSWLSSGEGIYWINGKAGSGKSTLMRYIYDHPKTQQHLTEWAGEIPLSIAGFFFWNSGTLEQRSQLGLLRSLLFEVLNKYKDLIPVVLPWLWARRYSRALDPSGHYDPDDLSLAKMMQAFNILLQQTKVSLKLCLFIDGLDEYEGDHERIAELFMNISRSAHVKICVSSRPLLVFDDAFSIYPRLKLQDLTFDDIKNYVHSRLSANPRYLQLISDEPIRAPALETEIVDRADGVFLWVRLVVDSLLNGLGNRDDIQDLQRRLRLLPRQLEKLYQHMLTSQIDPFYLDRASTMFQIVRKFTALGRPLSLITFALTDPSHTDRPISEPIIPWTANEISAVSQSMEDRMKVRCAGLLEVSGTTSTLHGLRAPKANGKVQFLHRTAKDYLEKREVWDMVLGMGSGTDFSPEMGLLRSYILQLKTLPPSSETCFSVAGLHFTLDCLDAWALATAAMQCAAEANLSSSRYHMALVDQLKLAVAHHKKDQPLVVPGSWSPPFLTIAKQYKLLEYVNKKSEDTCLKSAGHSQRQKFKDAKQPKLSLAKRLSSWPWRKSTSG